LVIPIWQGGGGWVGGIDLSLTGGIQSSHYIVSTFVPEQINYLFVQLCLKSNASATPIAFFLVFRGKK